MASLEATTPAKSPKKSPRTISVYLKRPVDEERGLLVANIRRDRLCTHSGAFRLFLKNWPVAYEDHRDVILPRCAPAALKHVLLIIKTKREDEELYIDVKNFDSAQRVAVWDACRELRLEPRQAQDSLLKTLCWGICHEPLTPKVLRLVWEVFGPVRDHEDDTENRAYHCMIHQYVWDRMHGRVSPEREQAIQATYESIQPLAEAIAAKEKELLSKGKRHTDYSTPAKRGAGRRQYESEWSQIEREIYEVVVGLRPITDELEPYVLSRKRDNLKANGENGDGYTNR